MYSFKMTEEIARWAFEVKCQEKGLWYTAFTNPTAGPWKTIKALDDSGKEGEVYRFDLEETRPDIVLVNDSLKTVIVFEAKDSLGKLIAGDQPQKSVEVVDKLCGILSSLKSNHFWRTRASYSIVTGLLWGALSPESPKDIDDVFNIYHKEMLNCKNICCKVIIGIESREQAGSITCNVFSKNYEKRDNSEYLKRILKSLG